MATESSSPQRTRLGLRAASIERFASQEYHLVLVNTPDAGKNYPLVEALRIGKAPDNDVVIEHPTVSRNHLVVRRQGDQFLVQDLGSTNGTFIDGAQVREGFLRPGALLEVGDVQLRFQPQLKSLEVSPTDDNRLGDLVGASVPMRQIFALIQRIAPTDSTLLLIGETGCGKGAAARTIHKLSGRATGPFVIFDCASVSENLIESELFGHEKGAFTGAVAQRVGCLERANAGTLFLDEIDDLPLDLQPKLLRALEDREFRRLGQSGGAHKFDTRVIAASKKDLWAETQAGRFREDLYFRLSVFTLTLPTLRDRKEDLPLLVDALAGNPLWGRLSERQREQFSGHTWPGNVRELRNAVERLKHVADIPELASENFLREYNGPAVQEGESLPADFAGAFKESKEALVRAFEREYLTRLLSKTKGNIAKAARDAGLDRKHLYSLLHKYGLVQPSAEAEDKEP
ncbi:MAG: sigma 54-dependent Fis family transcriptional regulator [Myxococcales bacterium]|nr:sigma 54-dependent Fis family transcriptional regulator [Myxococcales bacterium]